MDQPVDLLIPLVTLQGSLPIASCRDLEPTMESSSIDVHGEEERSINLSPILSSAAVIWIIYAFCTLPSCQILAYWPEGATGLSYR